MRLWPTGDFCPTWGFDQNEAFAPTRSFFPLHEACTKQKATQGLLPKMGLCPNSGSWQRALRDRSRLWKIGLLSSRKSGSNMQLSCGGDLPSRRLLSNIIRHNFTSESPIKPWFFSGRILTWVILVLVWTRKTLAHYLPFPTLTAMECSLSGPAALVCAETLRQEGFTDRIVMCSMDKHPPYDRPKLSKVCTESLQHTAQWRRAVFSWGFD